MKLEAMIFDMDGVLIDTLDAITDSFNEVLKRYGAELTPEQRKNGLGRSLRDQMEIWKKEYNFEIDIDHVAFSNEAFKVELDILKKNLKENKALINLLNDAKKKGIKLGVATSSNPKRAMELLNLTDLKKYFEVIITAKDVSNHKPHPEIFLTAAKKLNVSPENCVVFEDALSGVKAAKGGNMKVIAILTNLNSAKDFEGLADLTINDFSEISISSLNNLFN